MNGRSVDIAPGLVGFLDQPAEPHGIVILVDGSAGARELGRHRFIAGYLQRRRYATLLLEPADTGMAPARDDDAQAIHRLAHHVMLALGWLARSPELKTWPVALFGSGRGAAAGIVCAAERPECLVALVSRAAPLDRVAGDVARVRTPVLLVVGALDSAMREVTREGYRALTCEKQLEVVPRATHLFEEAGALERVALVAADWFDAHRPCGHA